MSLDRPSLSTLRATRRLVAGLVDAETQSATTAADLEIVTGELLTNAYQHAYPDQSGPIEITMIYDGRKIELTVSDEGDTSTGPLTIPASLPSEGWGLYVVGQLTDEVCVSQREKSRGVKVRVVKYVDRPREPDA